MQYLRTLPDIVLPTLVEVHLRTPLDPLYTSSCLYFHPDQICPSDLYCFSLSQHWDTGSNDDQACVHPCSPGSYIERQVCSKSFHHEVQGIFCTLPAFLLQPFCLLEEGFPKTHKYGKNPNNKLKGRTLHEFACHPCAGAMLIFSVSFQF